MTEEPVKVTRRSLREGAQAAETVEAVAKRQRGEQVASGSKGRRGKPKKKRRAPKIFAWILATLLVLVIAIAGVGVWIITKSFPQTSGDVTVSGLKAQVSVQRDERGIPTITASSSHDLFMAQGFVHAQDRFWEMDFRRHLTSARLSELFGESQLGTDKFLRALGWRDIAEQEVEALSPEVRGYYEAYAEGVNAYLAERKGMGLSLEYAVLGLQNSDYEPEPWSPADSIAWLKAMAWDLRTNIEDETARAILANSLEAAELAELYPAYPFENHPVIVSESADVEAEDTDAGANAGAGVGDEFEILKLQSSGAEGASGESTTASAVSGDESLDLILARVDSMFGGAKEGIGSNSWVVAGEFTETGKPLLANDPHLGAELPSVWTQMQLRCSSVSPECPFDVAGFSFSGLPGIVIGHNDNVAWGFTNLTTDVADLYIEALEGEQYYVDGELRSLTTRTETIKVAGGEDVTYEVKSTHHGPIISGLAPDFSQIANNAVVQTSGEKVEPPSSEFAVALQWTALEPGTTGEAIFALNTAKNFEDFRAAAEMFDVPAQNLIYADTDGNIGYQAPGRLPIRGAGDGWLPQPGWDSAYDWQGFIPFEAQPYLYNPKEGYIVTANNAIVNEDYPYFLSRDWDYGYRAARIEQLLNDKLGVTQVSGQDMIDIQMDNEHPAARALKDAYQGISMPTSETKQAVESLLSWNGQNSADSGAAAFANVLWNRITALMLSVFDADVPRDDQSRLVLFFEQQLADPDSRFLSVKDTRELTLITVAVAAYDEMVSLQGPDQSKWNWGELHALPLTHGTFGSSGITAIELLFNRGPIETGGGSGVVNATGWSLDEGYTTSTVPSFRMVIDLSDWDASTWQHLTGASGHAFHPNYTDQSAGWATGEQYAWNYSNDAVMSATKNTLTLIPAP